VFTAQWFRLGGGVVHPLARRQEVLELSPQDTMKKYERALVRQDWKSVEPLMHNDVCVTFSNGTFKGLNEVKGIFENNFASIQ
jgi:hypothetical protein